MCGTLCKQKIPKRHDIGRPQWDLPTSPDFLDKSSLKPFLLSPETVPSRKSEYASIITFPFDPA